VRFLKRERSRGQALVEVALVAPVFFLMVFGTIDIGRVVWANDAVANAAREGARYASVHAGFDGLTVPVTKADIRTHTLGYVIAAGINPSVTVCFASSSTVATQGAGCTGDVDETVGGTPVEYDRGNLVTVAVTSRVPIIVGSFFGAGNWTVTGESTVLINN
jgi:Flp pilus assembly protein TadG